MPTAISYPDTTGFRAGFQSTTLKINGVEFTGYKSLEGERTRERGVVYGPNADPLGKTRGKNSYKFSVEVYVAEFKAFMVDQFGAGYGDVQFSCEVDITEQGYDTQTHLIRGCTIDSSNFSFSEGTDALTMKVDFNPTKILFNKVDDNARPLTGAVAIA